MRIGIETRGLGHQVVFGMSRNTGSCWDNGAAYRLGYAPQDDSRDHAAGIDRTPPDPADPAQVYQGGPFVLAEAGGNPWKR